MNFYDRVPVVQIDGTVAFQNDEDERNENEVAEILTAYFTKKSGECEFHRFAKYHPLDWYVERKGNVIGLAELKCRNHTSTRFPTVYFAVRKWMSLKMAQWGLCVPAIFAASFTDEGGVRHAGGVFYIRVDDVDASRPVMRGCGKERAMKSENAVEPMIEIPIVDMHRVVL